MLLKEKQADEFQLLCQIVESRVRPAIRKTFRQGENAGNPKQALDFEERATNLEERAIEQAKRSLDLEGQRLVL